MRELHRHFDYKVGRPNQNGKQFLESLKATLLALKTPGEDWANQPDVDGKPAASTLVRNHRKVLHSSSSAFIFPWCRVRPVCSLALY
jgi:hypothetical protein